MPPVAVPAPGGRGPVAAENVSPVGNVPQLRRNSSTKSVPGRSSTRKCCETPDLRATHERLKFILMEKGPTEECRLARSNCGISESGSAGTLGLAGGSIAARSQSRRAPSAASADSLFVNHGQGQGNISTEDRVRAYLRDEIPELTAHVNAFIATRTEAVRKTVDSDLRAPFIGATERQGVFDTRANSLRWENQRRALLQKQLDQEMPQWICEAVQQWDQRSAKEHKGADEVNETDFVFDYLTKRSTHINSSKLATEIPIFKTLHASYMLPRMWRDKYL